MKLQSQITSEPFPLPSLPTNSEGVILPTDLYISATSESYISLIDDKYVSEVSIHLSDYMAVFTKGDQDFEHASIE